MVCYLKKTCLSKLFDIFLTRYSKKIKSNCSPEINTRGKSTTTAFDAIV